MSTNPFTPLSALSRSIQGSPSRTSQSQTSHPAQSDVSGQQRPKKRRNHRGGRKKRQRRKSFAILDEDEESRNSQNGDGLYAIPSANLSGTSIDSEALLDHRLVIVSIGCMKPTWRRLPGGSNCSGICLETWD